MIDDADDKSECGQRLEASCHCFGGGGGANPKNRLSASQEGCVIKFSIRFVWGSKSFRSGFFTFCFRSLESRFLSDAIVGEEFMLRE